MSSTSVADWLEREGAHHDVVKWAQGLGDDFSRAYDACPRPDWLIGIAVKRGADPRAVVRAACACARFALEYVPDDDARPARAIDVALAWAEGDPDAEIEAAKIAVEASAQEATDPASAAAATSALAAISAVEEPEHAAVAAASAVQAAMMDAGDCALSAAMSYAQTTCLSADREHLPAW